jgi:hypothetical protein
MATAVPGFTVAVGSVPMATAPVTVRYPGSPSETP